MNFRSKNVLTKILLQDEKLDIDELAVLYNVSTRTIRYDLDEIDSNLSSYNITSLKREKDRKIYFVGSIEEKGRLISLLNSMDYLLHL